MADWTTGYETPTFTYEGGDATYTYEGGDGSGGEFTAPSATFLTLGSATRRWEELYAKSPTINTSDPRHKKFVKDCDLGLDFIMSLRPVSFQWRVESQGARHYGFLGNEVIDALKGKPFAGVVNSTGGIGIRYTELISPLVAAIQEQQKQIETLKVEVRKLRRKQTL